MTSFAAVALLVLAAPVEVQVSHRRVTAGDGAALAVYRYQRPGVVTSLPPVVLVPDVGFSRAAYDFEGRGLARWLSAAGRLVYVVELRGQGKSGPGLALEPMAMIDLPAVLDALKLEQVDLVVHGWVGSLVLAAHGQGARVRRVVALNTPMLAAPPSTLASAFLADGGRFSTLASSPSGARTFHELFALWAELPERTEQAFLATGTRDLSRPVAAELLAWMNTGDRPLAGRSVVARLSEARVPTLLLLGLADGFAPPEQCAVLRERMAGPVEVHAFSRAEGGEDFSHLSMLLGRDAPKKVFPRVGAFLGEVAP
ncbi:MAG: alpha/beta hydrolase [Myxococcaceae bacterium]|nr:alpha/beta hydrolase [Myxococcaceae bacterium]